MSKTIELTNGAKAIVDNDDYSKYVATTWNQDRRGYARRNTYIGGGRAKPKYKTILLHRLIADAPSHMQVDHINGNPLDNRKSNLRLCTQAENCRNAAKRKNSRTSRYKGVCWDSESRKWLVQIQVNEHQTKIGRFHSETVAAESYNKAAKKYYGQFARLNQIEVNK